MKNIVLLAFLSILVAGCDENASKEKLDSGKVVHFPVGGNRYGEMYEADYDGHQYLVVFHAGIIHKVSCAGCNPKKLEKSETAK